MVMAKAIAKAIAAAKAMAKDFQFIGRLSERFSKFIIGILHESAHSDPVLEARHRNFQITHIVSGLFATTFLFIYFNAFDVHSLPAYVFYFWFASPLAIAVFLSRTGRIDIAQFLSSLNLAGLAGCAAFFTGGVHSPLILWLLLVPLEAALSRRRVITYAGVVVSCLTLMILFVATLNGRVPVALTGAINEEVFSFFSTLAAIAYAGGLAGTVQTMNRQSSAALNASQENYRFLADNATDLITRHGSDGGVLFASQACEQILGVSAGELERDGLLDWVHVGDRPAYMRAISNSANEGESVSVEFRVRNNEFCDGAENKAGYRWVEMRCRPVSIARRLARKNLGKAEVLAVTRDISLRKAQELELARAKEYAEDANRAKSLFVASISHELRTPLNAICGFSDILSTQLRAAELDEKYSEYSDIIRDSGEHLARIVNDILDLSKIEAGKFEISCEGCDLDELIAMSCNNVRPMAQKNDIDIDHVEAGAVEGHEDVLCDPRAVKQILINLISNAVKFSGNGRSVEVTSEYVGADVLIKVVDHGVGIAAEDIEKLGRPFVQAENDYSRKFEGTGLGLCVVNGLVELHDGTMTIESEVGRGTMVCIQLPISGPEVKGPDVVDISQASRRVGLPDRAEQDAGDASEISTAC